MSATVSRRMTLAYATALVVKFAAPGPATAAGGSVSIIRVDVAPLRSNSPTDEVDWVAGTLPSALKKSLALHWSVSGGATVTAQISYLALGVVLSTSGGGPSGNSRREYLDTIEGDVTLIGSDGATIGRSHLLATRNAPNSTSDLHSRQLRVNALCESFAYWTPRKLGL